MKIIRIKIAPWIQTVNASTFENKISLLEECMSSYEHLCIKDRSIFNRMEKSLRCYILGRKIINKEWDSYKFKLHHLEWLIRKSQYLCDEDPLTNMFIQNLKTARMKAIQDLSRCEAVLGFKAHHMYDYLSIFLERTTTEADFFKQIPSIKKLIPRIIKMIVQLKDRCIKSVSLELDLCYFEKFDNQIKILKDVLSLEKTLDILSNK